jgi:hypothetical protein
MHNPIPFIEQLSKEIKVTGYFSLTAKLLASLHTTFNATSCKQAI